MRKRFTALLLCLALLFTLYIPVTAEEAAAADLTITTADEFLTFAQNCRLDRYSQNLTVSLEADIDLENADFSGVPIFCGMFRGNGYKISGVRITTEGSTQGLFRYLTAGAVISDLRVHGEILPQGSRSTVGGIVGDNAGTIRGCSFTGTVRGVNNVGGITGSNRVTGIVETCSAKGTVSGTHFVGGIVGRNSGAIRSCENTASINADSAENTVNLSDLTMESITNSEAANVSTDIGGIAGMSSGLIRSSVNKGTVGYLRMGYNVGGIAGSQSGYILDCENHGTVSGRKEVGGIVGQIEPVLLVQYDTDTLQILRGQLGTLDGMANQASGDMKQSSDTLRSQYDTLGNQINDAQEALDILTPESLDQIPDRDTLLAAQNTLNSSLTGMPKTLESMQNTAESTVTSLLQHINKIAGQVNVIGNTLKNQAANLGGTFSDASDRDTANDISAKVENCVNSGTISADRSGGGIAGAIAIENELDHEDDLEISGSSSLHFDGDIRAVILNCQNGATISVKKQNAGGIIGWQSMGLVKSCISNGAVEAASADYAGGIAGRSSGYLRDCYARCTIAGKRYVGGVAGTGAIVSDCRAMTKISAGENCGSILGARTENNAETENPIRGNYYLCVEEDHGGIDGISYDGAAQPLEKDAFLALEALPEMFRFVSIRFTFADESEKVFTVEPGSAFPLSDIPAIPNKRNHIGSWENLDESALSAVYFDMSFTVSYTAYDTVIRSVLYREKTEMPILLIEGDFPLDECITLRKCSDALPNEELRLIEAWSYVVSENGNAETLRYCLPQQEIDGAFTLYIRDDEEEWREAEYIADGSYLVFDVDSDDTAFAVYEAPFDPTPLIWIGAAALVLLILIIILLCCRARRKRIIRIED